MKLVMTYTVGDGCSWSADETIPFEYESVEKAEYDFLTLCEQSKTDYQSDSPVYRSGYFKFCNREFNWNDFYYRRTDFDKKGNVKHHEYKYSEPRFRTLEQWFMDERVMEIT